MILYRYFGTHAFETVRDGRLKVSKLSDFNDPFEGLYYFPEEIDIKEARRAAETQKRRNRNPEVAFCSDQILTQTPIAQLTRAIKASYPQLLERLQQSSSDFQKLARVISFTSSEIDPATEIVIWSHYAQHHSGIRIGIDFPNWNASRYTIEPVSYSLDRIKVLLGDFEDQDGRNLYDAHFHKSVAWKYEMEHRLQTLPEYCEKDGLMGLEFLRFNPAWIRRIDFGLRCPMEKIGELADFVRSKLPSIELKQAKVHPTKYEMVYLDLP